MVRFGPFGWIPSFPRRRESRNCSTSVHSRDSRLRGNDKSVPLPELPPTLEILCRLGPQDVALYLSGEIAKLGAFRLISDGGDIPVFAFTTTPEANFSVFDMSDKLRERGWLLPAYSLPKNRQDLAVLRAVCKEGFTRDMAEILLKDLRAAVDFFAARTNHQPKTAGTSFAH